MHIRGMSDNTFRREKHMATSTTQLANATEVQHAYAEVNWTQYDGERVIGSKGGAVYLALNGQLCWIPDPTTYNNLFKDWNGIVVNDYLINNMPHGATLTSGAVLAQATGTAPVYLATNNMKM